MMLISNELNFKIVGRGYPVVFLHGFLESISMWDYIQIEKFPFQSILIDLPGHGKSLNEDDNEPSIDFMAEKVLGLLSKLEICIFSIVGHSMGGYVALEVKNKSLKAENSIIECQKVVLLNSNFWIDNDSKKNDRLRVAEIVFKNKELFLNTAIPNLFNEPTRYRNQISKLLNEALLLDEHAIAYSSLAMRNRKDLSSLVTSFDSDFLIIQGEEDSIVPKEVMEEFISNLNVEYCLLKNSGHMAHIQSSEFVRDVICDFILKGKV